MRVHRAAEVPRWGCFPLHASSRGSHASFLHWRLALLLMHMHPLPDRNSTSNGLDAWFDWSRAVYHLRVILGNINKYDRALRWFSRAAPGRWQRPPSPGPSLCFLSLRLIVLGRTRFIWQRPRFLKVDI